MSQISVDSCQRAGGVLRRSPPRTDLGSCLPGLERPAVVSDLLTNSSGKRSSLAVRAGSNKNQWMAPRQHFRTSGWVGWVLGEESVSALAAQGAASQLRNRVRPDGGTPLSDSKEAATDHQVRGWGRRLGAVWGAQPAHIPGTSRASHSPVISDSSASPRRTRPNWP